MRDCNLPCSVPSGAVMPLVAPAKWIKGMGVLTTLLHQEIPFSGSQGFTQSPYLRVTNHRKPKKGDFIGFLL